MVAVLNDGKPHEAPVYLHHKNGHRVPVTVRGQAIRDSDGVIVGSVEVFFTRVSNPDATDRRARRDDSLDPVTGLAPRRLGELALQALLLRPQDRRRRAWHGRPVDRQRPARWGYPDEVGRGGVPGPSPGH